MKGADIPLERGLSLETARSLVETELKSRNLRYQLRFLGSKHPTAQVSLFDSENKFQILGSGKGPGLQAEVGAMFEALEHYITEVSPPAINVGDFNKLQNIDLCNDERAIEVIRETANTPLAYRSFRSLGNDLQLDYPHMLLDPFYEARKHPKDSFSYEKITKYTSNSGIAIGASLDEALLHAFNQILERDAISRFLARCFYKTLAPVYTLRPTSLPPSLKPIYDHIGTELGFEPYIIDLSSFSMVPVYLALGKRVNGCRRLYGAGASLDSEHALSRALYELLQNERLRPYSPESEDIPQAFYQFNSWISALEIPLEALPDHKISMSDFTAQRSPVRTLPEQINEIQKRVINTQRQLFYDVIEKSANGTCTVCVHITGLDRFQNIFYYMPVLPNRTTLT